MVPWDCPTFETPADAYATYVDAGTIEPEYLALRALAEAYITSECVFETDTTTVDDSMVTSEEIVSTCTYGDVTVVESTFEADYYSPYSSSGEESAELEVWVGGDTWTRIRVWEASNGYGEGVAWSNAASFGAEWDGSVDGLPDDGFVREGSSASYYSDYGDRSWGVATPTCEISCLHSDRAEDQAYTVVANGVEAGVARWWEGGACSQLTSHVEDVEFGAWLGDWSHDPADADADSYLPPCDCDDTDPAVHEIDGRGCWDWDDDGYEDTDCDDADAASHPGADDIAGDGIDQDCDGADDVDADGDGYTVDGDDQLADCDDAEARAFPGGDDPAGDGIDGDCDGADDVDADGDGFTADGDDDAADCDDADATANPDGVEIEDDGVDQDCDGVDAHDIDLDDDGYTGEADGGDDCDDADASIHPDAVEVECDDVDQDCDGEDDCPVDWPEEEEPEEDEGCGGSSGGCSHTPAFGVWALLAVVGARRRSPLPS